MLKGVIFMKSIVITSEQLQVALVGTPASEALIGVLNSRLQNVICTNSPGESGELNLHVSRMTTTILGNSSEDASLHVEMVTEELPFSPFFITTPLRGAAKSPCRINHDFFSKVRLETRKIIVDFCKEIADSYEFFCATT